MQTNVRYVRNSSFELLRIIAMFMIVLSHSSFHSYFDLNSSLSLNSIFMNCCILGNLGVDIFVMISGYFLISSSRVKWNKFFMIVFEVFCYSVIINSVFCFFLGGDFSLKATILSIFPIITNKYWFMSAYIVLYILHPYINRLLKTLAERELRIFLLIILLLWCIIPTLFFGLNTVSDLSCFVLMYCIGAYIKLKEGFFLVKSKKKAIEILIISMIALFGSTVIFKVLGTKANAFNSFGIVFYSKYSVLVIAISICLIIIFSCIDINSKFINTIASTTLGIYLLHDEPSMREFLWKCLFSNEQLVNSNVLILHTLYSATLVFIAGIVIDLLRQQTLERIGDFVFCKMVNFLSKKESINRYL